MSQTEIGCAAGVDGSQPFWTGMSWKCGFGMVGLAILTVAVGCSSGDGLNRKAVSGKVTVDGKAIPNGQVAFEPLFQGGLSGGSVITNGEYKIAQEQGLTPGKYRVSINGNDGTNFGVSAGKMPGDEEMPAIKELVPAEWNSASKKEIEVTDAGPNTFDFAITSK